VRISLICVGRLAAAAEATLAADWARRATLVGRPLGLGPVEILEVRDDAALLARAAGARLIACDERGQSLSSRDFAAALARLRDDGERRLAFAVGGTDGLGESVRAAAQRTLAFGPQTWPHALARAMLAEQVYRAATLMAGTPYHRD
jgi:23S rRNA (pseudouridine1915-N3)-methyltransferase